MVGLQRIMLVLVVFGAGRHSVQWNVFTNKEVIQMKLLLSIFVAGTTALGSVALSPAAFTSAQAVAQGLNETFEAHPSTQDPSVKVTLETLARWETELSNWGKWGPTDQRGTLNYITPQKTRAATRLVEDGVTVNLGHFINEDDALDSGNFWPSEHQMTSVDPVTGKPRFALDAVSFSLHDGQLAHMDALCHYSMPRNGQDVIFNGYPQNMTADGCVGDLAINDMGPGYVTRAILVDMPLLRGVDYLEPATPIYVSDLEEWEDFAGVRPLGPTRSTRAVALRSGWGGATRFRAPLAQGEGRCPPGRRRRERRSAFGRGRHRPAGPHADPGDPRSAARGQRLSGGRCP